MSTTNLMNDGKSFADGLDGIVVVNNYTSKRGGASLDVTGYPLPNIRAGHVIIKETATGNFKPMPVVVSGAVATGVISNAGTGYVNAGTYNAVALTGGTGTGATANITVVGGSITNVVMVNKGTGYKAGDTLSAAAASIGTGGTGFAYTVTASNAAAVVYGTLPAEHTYAGHAVQSVLTAKAMVGIMYNGEINNLVVNASKGVFDLTSILSAVKTALPQMMYTGDNA